MQSMTLVAWLCMAVLALISGLQVAAAAESNVIVLDSDNFEHLTQASTGATTGDWLVEFYAPWCGHCKKLTPVYEKVADELKGSINVAKVDVTANQDLGKRFGIRGFPTILFFTKGKYYKFSGPQRTLETLTKFAEGGYLETSSGVAVPGTPTFTSQILNHAQTIKTDFITLLGTKKNVLLATFSGGLLFGLLLGCLCGCCTGRGSKTADVLKPKNE